MVTFNLDGYKMDTTPIVARLSVIANSVNAIKELERLTYDEFARYVSEYVSRAQP
jgi:hypothetical protein